MSEDAKVESPRGGTHAVQTMFARACFGKDTDRAFGADLASYLQEHSVDDEDAAALLAAPRRLGLYRRLVRSNVTGVIETMLEATKVRCERAEVGAFAASIAEFLDEAGPRTSHLRDVPAEFLEFIAPRWRGRPQLPRWLVDFASLELLDFTIGVAPRPEPPPPLAEVSAELPLVFAEPKRLIHLEWAVNVVSREDAADEPEHRPVSILVYRDSAHVSRFLELTPLAAAILERLFAGDSLGAAMVSACESRQHPLDDDVLTGAARLLADLAERGVLLGARELGVGP